MRPRFGRFFCGRNMADKYGLSPRQRAFVEHYVVLNNATQAYINAGYSPKNAGPNAGALIKRTNIQQAIEALRPKNVDIKDMVTPQDVINGLMAETRGEHAPTRVSAWREVGRALGMFVDRQESKLTTSFADEIESLQDEIKAAVRDAPSLRVVK